MKQSICDPDGSAVQSESELDDPDLNESDLAMYMVDESRGVPTTIAADSAARSSNNRGDNSPQHNRDARRKVHVNNRILIVQ